VSGADTDEETIGKRVARERDSVAARVVEEHVRDGDHVFDEYIPGLEKRSPRVSKRHKRE
jgi:hypothetical protein